MGLKSLVSVATATDALQRLGIPLKAVADGTNFEDWQETMVRYGDDPEIGWILMGVWPLQLRDGTVAKQSDVAGWQREHQKKPMVTYWDIAVQMAFLCGFTVDSTDTAVQATEMAIRILKGEDLKTIKAESPRKINISLNRKTATNLGIVFSLDVLNLANVIYDDYEGKQVIRK